MHVSFNQDASCVVTGTEHGFRVYNCAPFGKFYTSEETSGGYGLARMLFATSLVALVGNGELNSPRRLAVVNTRKSGPQSVICELTFPTAVRNLLLNRQRLVVVLDAQIYIYNIANMKLLYTLDTVANRGGVASITPRVAEGNNWLVYPAGPQTKHHLSPPKTAGDIPKAPQGDVVVFDMDTLAPVTVVKAHRSPVALLALNEDGTLLATTSDKGTIIRVFAIPSGTLLYELRRGSYQSTVYSIAFSLGSKLLCVSSATQTVHIYRLDAANRAKERETEEAEPVSEERKKKWLKGWTSSTSRDFAWFKVPVKHTVRTVVGMPPLSNLVYVATDSGRLFHFSLENGGECRKVGDYQMD